MKKETRNKYCLVYMATNKTNGKQYIGQTSWNINKRINSHVANSRRKIRVNTYFTNAIRKYGRDGFTWEVIASGVEDKDISFYERAAIWAYDTYNNGYNSTPGGEISPMLIPEVAAKVAAARLGTKCSPESSEKKRLAMLGKPCPTRKLTEQQVLEIVDLFNTTDMTNVSIAKLYPVMGDTISSIRTGARWSNLTGIKYNPRTKK